MVIFVRNPVLRALLFILPIVIFAIIYFTVIRPDNNSANNAIKNAEQQSSQAVKDAQQQLKAAGSAVPNSAKTTVDKAQKLTDCITAAGTDTGKIAACQSQFG